MASLPLSLPLPPGFRRPLVCALIAGAVSACGAMLLPDAFRCEARILSDAGRGPSPWRAGVWAPSASPEPLGTREEGPTVVYSEILRSRRVADRLLATRYEYPCRPWRFGRVRRVQGTLLDYLGAPDPDRAQGAFRRLLTVDRNPRSGLLTLAAETRSPELSLMVVRDAVEELRLALVDLGQAEGRNRARTAGERLGEVEGIYRARAEAFRNFQDANRNWEGSPSPNLRFQGAQLREQLDLWRQVLANLTLNHEQALLDARNDAQTLLVLDPGGLPRARSRPHRSFIVLGAMVATGVVSWAVLNPSTFHHLFFAKEHP